MVLQNINFCWPLCHEIFIGNNVGKTHQTCKSMLHIASQNNKIEKGKYNLPRIKESKRLKVFETSKFLVEPISFHS